MRGWAALVEPGEALRPLISRVRAADVRDDNSTTDEESDIEGVNDFFAVPALLGCCERGDKPGHAGTGVWRVSELTSGSASTDPEAISISRFVSTNPETLSGCWVARRAFS